MVAPWLLCLAHFAPVPNEKMVGTAPERLRDGRHKLLFDTLHGFMLGKAQTLGDAKDVRVHCEGRNMKGIAEHHVRRFAPYAWQLLQKRAIWWYFAAIFLDEHL